MSDIELALESEDRPIREVRTPEWKCKKVYVRSLSALEMLDLEDRTENSSKSEKVAVQLSTYLCDKDGKRNCTQEQAKKLLAKSATVVIRIISEGHKLNGSDALAQESLRKN